MLSVALAALSLVANAQSFNSAIVGSVTDQTGGSIAAAELKEPLRLRARAELSARIQSVLRQKGTPALAWPAIDVCAIGG